MRSRADGSVDAPQECFLRARARRVVNHRYELLHPDGKRLIVDWLKRGLPSRGTSRESFEGLIYLWIGFNAWAACVTDQEKDFRMVADVARDQGVKDDFTQACDDPVFVESVNRFGELWPIFRAQEIARKSLTRWPDPSEARETIVQSYLDGGAHQFAPKCFLLHKSHLEDVPCDWAHTVTAAYSVRCNLFHGGKTRSSESDVEVVDATHAVLGQFVKRALLPRLN